MELDNVSTTTGVEKWKLQVIQTYKDISYILNIFLAMKWAERKNRCWIGWPQWSDYYSQAH